MSLEQFSWMPPTAVAFLALAFVGIVLFVFRFIRLTGQSAREYKFSTHHAIQHYRHG